MAWIYVLMVFEEAVVMMRRVWRYWSWWFGRFGVCRSRDRKEFLAFTSGDEGHVEVLIDVFTGDWL